MRKSLKIGESYHFSCCLMPHRIVKIFFLVVKAQDAVLVQWKFTEGTN